MARQPRIELPDVPLHVIQRGNNRGRCFFVDADCRLYLRCLAQAATRHECAIHAYVLMPNHVHLLVTPCWAGGVARMMQDVGRRYVRLFNDTHERSGTLWEGRYKSCLVDTERYLLTCHRYIELNPVRAGLVRDPLDYPWSSHRFYAAWHVDPLITMHELYEKLATSRAGRQAAFRKCFVEPMHQQVVDQIRVTTNRGWALGSESFMDQAERVLGRPVRPPKRGRPLKKKEGVEADDTTGAQEMLI